METGIVGVAAITAVCYLIGLVVKATPWNNDKYIPIACGFSGALLGLVAFSCGMPDYPAADPITALAVGVVSGLAATGVDQLGKQLSR